MPPAPIKKTLYEILGVAANASAAEIKAAHDARLERAGAGNSDHDRAARVALSEAFGVLSNAPRRAAYDARLNSLAAEPVAATAARPASGPGRVRWVVAALIGLAGAYIAVLSTKMWIADMTGGRGWIAVSLVIFHDKSGELQPVFATKPKIKN